MTFPPLKVEKMGLLNESHPKVFKVITLPLFRVKKVRLGLEKLG